MTCFREGQKIFLVLPVLKFLQLNICNMPRGQIAGYGVWTQSLERADGNRLGETKDTPDCRGANWNPQWTLTTSNYDDVDELQDKSVPSPRNPHKHLARIGICWRRQSSGNWKPCCWLLPHVRVSQRVRDNVHELQQHLPHHNLQRINNG